MQLMLLFRPILPSDKPLLVAGLRALSVESAMKRFLSPKVSFSQSELRYLTEVDQHDHIAYVAMEGERLVAVARCVRAGDGDVADVAIVVGDPWQRRGLGRTMLQLLARRALAEGITRFSGTMLADNRAALRLMRTFELESSEISYGVRDVVVRLTPSSARADAAAGERPLPAAA
jgi:RimJ/RimL family protein N-acetyltransferase